MGNVNKTSKKNSKRKKVRMRLIDLRLEGLLILVWSSVKLRFVNDCCLERVIFSDPDLQQTATFTSAKSNCYVAALS